MAHYQAGRLAEAEALCRAVLDHAPEHGTALQLLGVIAHRRGDGAAALGHLRRAVEAHPGDATAHFNLGTLLKDLDAPEEAASAFQTAVGLAPRYADAYVNLGGVLRRVGRLDEAIGAYRRAIRINPRLAQAHFGLALALEEAGDGEAAVAGFRQAAMLDTRNPEMRLRLGAALAAMGRHAEAVTWFRRALALAPAMTAALVDLGSALAALGQASEAEDAFREALALDPELAPAHHDLGVVLKAQGRRDEAIASYRRAIALDDANPESHYNLGIALNEAGAREDAAECFRRAVALAPDMRQAAHMLASLTGTTTETAPREYVESLFDVYAPTFESHLLGRLEYRAPELLRDLVAGLSDAPPRFANAVDLGCGTGLAGVLLRPLVGRLTGIDLSRRMIAEAEHKGIYDRLVAAEIGEALAAAEESYDLFVAADSLNYIGNLAPVFAAVRARARPGALFAFTTEAGEGADYVLSEWGRYRHARAFVERLAAEHGFTLAEVRSAPLRRQQGTPVAGDLFALVAP